MRFKNFFIAANNQLNLGEWGFLEANVEVIDLNKKLQDLLQDEAVFQHILHQLHDKNKVYIICVKENFNQAEADFNLLPNFKKTAREIKKKYRKCSNLFFFIYNTFAKNPQAFEANLNAPAQNNILAALKKADVTTDNADLNHQTKSESTQANKLTLAQPNKPTQAQAITLIETETKTTDEAQAITLIETETKTADEAQAKESEVITKEVELEQPTPAQQEELTPTMVLGAEHITETQTVIAPTSKHQSDMDVSTISTENQSTQTKEQTQETSLFGFEQTPVVQTNQPSQDALELEKIIAKEYDDFEKPHDQFLRTKLTQQSQQANLTTEQASINKSDVLTVFDEKALGVSLEDQQNQAALFPNKEDVSIPESFFDATKKETINYEDYQEYVNENEYELDVHTLKAIFDFIWRILVLNNHSLRLHDLLYIAVNHLEAFSVGQSDFIRQILPKADSLFDLILQLDTKLAFNNSLFYIYLADFFTFKNNNIIVSAKFLANLAVWVNAAAKAKFAQQIEDFINYSTVYNKKIIFAHFIAFAAFLKGHLPVVNPNLQLIDIHRILQSIQPKFASSNVFANICAKVHVVFNDYVIVPEVVLTKTPENFFQSNVDETNWQKQLVQLYKRLLENVWNYVLLKGNKERDIFNLYIDIKDLRMYQKPNQDKSGITPEVCQTLGDVAQGLYTTIGDVLLRDEALHPNQNTQTKYDANTYLNTLEQNQPSPLAALNTTSSLNAPAHSTQTLVTTLPKKFALNELEESMSKRIRYCEQKVRDNISRIETERKILRAKLEQLKNL